MTIKLFRAGDEMQSATGSTAIERKFVPKFVSCNPKRTVTDGNTVVLDEHSVRIGSRPYIGYVVVI